MNPISKHRFSITVCVWCTIVIVLFTGPVHAASVNFFKQLYMGSRNDLSGWQGFEFLPTNNITVTALGRAVSGTMNANHDVKIWKVSDQSIVAATTVLPSSSTDTYGYKYVTLSTPVTLIAGTRYRIASLETAGGDRWMDLGDVANHRLIAQVMFGVWSSGGSFPANATNASNQSYVPPTFYSEADSVITPQQFWGNKSSVTTIGVPNQLVYSETGAITYTFRTYFKPREYGTLELSFWTSNGIDSWSEGASPCNTNQPGGTWTIDAAYYADGGTSINGSVVTGSSVPVKFSGSTTKTVIPGERFWSDSAILTIPNNHYVAFTWTLSTTSSGTFIPSTAQSQYSVYEKTGNNAQQETNSGFNVNASTVAPNLFAYKKSVVKRIGFLGNSITQGYSATKDGYQWLASGVAQGLGTTYGIWNLGSGWAHAYDAASDGYWLDKAKKCNEIVLCLGVNDVRLNQTASQIITNLSTIVSLLKQNNPQIRVFLCTVPPFNFTGAQATTWRSVNTTIRTNPPSQVDAVFDFAAVLTQPAPNDNLIRTEYAAGDPHPNDAGNQALTTAFLTFYRGLPTGVKKISFAAISTRTSIPGKLFYDVRGRVVPVSGRKVLRTATGIYFLRKKNQHKSWLNMNASDNVDKKN